MMRLKAAAYDDYCLETKKHVSHCNLKSHTCLRCGIYLGSCDCPVLGSPLDY